MNIPRSTRVVLIDIPAGQQFLLGWGGRISVHEFGKSIENEEFDTVYLAADDAVKMFSTLMRPQ